MNYTTGKKIVLGAFSANLAIMLLMSATSLLPLNIISAAFTVLNAISTILPAAIALGFAMMYADGLDKLDLILAGAAAINFVAVFLYQFVNYTSDLFLIVSVLLDCLCAILPIAWAIKLRHKTPALSIAMVIAGVWTALSSILYLLPNLGSGDVVSSARYTLMNLANYAVSALFILVAFLDKKPESNDEDTREEIDN